MEQTKQCPKCSSDEKIKRGIVRKQQRYQCKSCGYLYTVMKLGKSFEKSYVIRSLQLYLEGLGFRSIERIMGISHVTVMNWVKKYGKELSFLKKQDSVSKEVEVDELHSYVGDKKTKYGSGLLLEGIVKKCWVVRSAAGEPIREDRS